MRAGAGAARKSFSPCQPASAWIHSKGPVHRFHEVSLFAKNQALFPRHVEIRARFRVASQAVAVVLVRGEAVEPDQPPGNVVGALVGQEVSYQAPAASWDDAAPIPSVLL